MFDFENELNNFAVIKVKLKNEDLSDFEKNNDYIIYDKIKEMILKQKQEEKYFVTFEDKNEVITKELLIYSDGNNSLIYDLRSNIFSFFDVNFSFLCLYNMDDPVISGIDWDWAYRNFSIKLYNEIYKNFSLNPNEKRKNHILCKSSIDNNKVTSFIFEEDFIKVMIYRSPIEYMKFDYNGDLQSFKLLNRISNDEITVVDNYSLFLRKIAEYIDLRDICFDERISLSINNLNSNYISDYSIMDEEKYNITIKFIKNFITIYDKIKLFDCHHYINENIFKHFEDLKLLSLNLNYFSFDSTKLENTIEDILNNTPYKDLLNEQITDSSLYNIKIPNKDKTLMFLSLIKLKGLTFEDLLPLDIINKIKFINENASIISKSNNGLNNEQTIKKITY